MIQPRLRFRVVGSTQFCCRLTLFVAILAAPPAARADRSNSLMDISADGRLLACSNRDSGTVTIVDLTLHTKLHEVPVGSQPEGVTFLGDSHALAVAVYADDQVVFLNGDSGERIGVTAVFDEPYGVVTNKPGTKIYVTLEYPGQVVEINTESKTVERTFAAGQFPRGLAMTSDEGRLLVTEYFTAAVVAIDVATGREADRWPPGSLDNLPRQIVVHPTRPKAYFSHIRSRIAVAHGEGSIFPYVGVIDTATSDEQRRKRIPMDSFLGNLVTANPWEIAVSPDGRRLYVIFSGTDDMFVCDVLDDNYREIAFSRHLKLGRNPRAVRVSPESTRFYVYNALDFTVVAYDAASAKVVATIPVCDNPLGDEILLGKRLFYTALQPMTGQRWISCSSCHPDGNPDGRTWQNPEGLRNTPPLFGLAWTHPQHWSADRDETQDFEHTIRGQLMQGQGLIRGTINTSLGSPNKGLSAELDALAAYTNSHKFTLSPHAKGGLSEAAQRGKSSFFSEETKCATCHSGPLYSDSVPSPKIVRHNVGTGEADPSEKMGPEYDSPTLLGVYRSAPYLHHGMAKSLIDVLTTHNSKDSHGKTSHMSESQLIDLVAFLKSLPYEDPEVTAKAAGLPKVEH